MGAISGLKEGKESNPFSITAGSVDLTEVTLVGSGDIASANPMPNSEDRGSAVLIFRTSPSLGANISAFECGLL
jgi:hypothetical protein